MIITIEGSDGCGKHTQTELLYKHLIEKRENYKLVSFPNYDSEGCGAVKMYLRGDFGDINSLDAYQVNSFYAVDRLCTIKQYDEHLKSSGNFVFDRYVQSSMMYQSAMLDSKKEINKFLKYVENFEYNVLKIPKPDVVIFLDMPIKYSKKLADLRQGYKSGDNKDIYESNVEYLKKSYKIGKFVAKKCGWIIINCVDDNGKIKTIDEIHKEILTKLGI